MILNIQSPNIVDATYPGKPGVMTYRSECQPDIRSSYNISSNRSIYSKRTPNMSRNRNKYRGQMFIQKHWNHQCVYQIPHLCGPGPGSLCLTVDTWSRVEVELKGRLIRSVAEGVMTRRMTMKYVIRPTEGDRSQWRPTKFRLSEKHNFGIVGDIWRCGKWFLSD